MNEMEDQLYKKHVSLQLPMLNPNYQENPSSAFISSNKFYLIEGKKSQHVIFHTEDHNASIS